ncbi:MAG: hypothetical protein WAO71_09270 [Gallionella sp.]
MKEFIARNSRVICTFFELSIAEEAITQLIMIVVFASGSMGYIKAVDGWLFKDGE